MDLSARLFRALMVVPLVLLLLFVASCEKRTRTRNSTGSDGLFEEEGRVSNTSVYRFMGAKQSMVDARQAAKTEQWDKAVAATDALLAQEPANAEGQQLNAQAKLELAGQRRMTELTKSLAANDVAGAMRHARGIPEGSMYKARAGEAIDKVKDVFIDSQLVDARAMVRTGRCDDARHIARVTGDAFPDARARLEDAARNCRPARDEKPDSTVAAAEKPAPAPPPAAAPPPAPGASAPIAMADTSRGSRSGIETRNVVASVSSRPQPSSSMHSSTPTAPPPSAPVAPAPAPAPAPVASTTPPAAAPQPAADPSSAPAAPSGRVRSVPMAQLEALRTAGDKTPSLPTASRQAASRDSVAKLAFMLKICVSEAGGAPTSVAMVKGTNYSDANNAVLAEVKKWRFKPFMADGQAVPVCSATLLSYQVD